MKPNKLFVYGILKSGYELDLLNYGAKFIGEAHIPGAALYGIGRHWNREGHPNDGREYDGVGLKLDVGPLEVVQPWTNGQIGYDVIEGPSIAHGELWEIPDSLWDWLDQIEQNGRVYTRKIVKVCMDRMEGDCHVVNAWTYEHTHMFQEKDRLKGGRF